MRVVDNPMATPEQIKLLASRSPLSALRHPNCPRELFYDLAARRPIEALRAPAFALLQLEDPALWASIEARNAPNWTVSFMDKLSWEQEQDFAADCLEDALQICAEVARNNDTTCVLAGRLENVLGLAVQGRRELAANKITFEDFNRKVGKARALCDYCEPSNGLIRGPIRSVKLLCNAAYVYTPSEAVRLCLRMYLGIREHEDRAVPIWRRLVALLDKKGKRKRP